MTLLIREDLTEADLVWAAQAFARRPAAVAAVAAVPAPARGQVPPPIGLGKLAAAAGLALVLAGHAGAASTTRAPDSPLAGGAARATVTPGWTVQASVQEQLRADLAGTKVAFSLVSAQATRLDRGGRRFEGSGLAQLDGRETRFVSFSLSVDLDGRVSAFDYGMATSGETDDVLAVR
ncbi:hypothetical protein [Arenimonas soli]|nr:hypothetical protein [Arenimonas soli]